MDIQHEAVKKKFRRSLEIIRLQTYTKVLGAFSWFIRRKTNNFAVKLRRILEVLRFQVLQKKFRVHFHDLCVQKRSCLPWSSDRFQTFSPCKHYKKVGGAFSRSMRPKMKLCAVKFKRILEALRLRGLQKMSGRIFTIYMLKNEAVCREVHTHFASSLPARFTEKLLGAFSRFMRPKTKRFAVEFRRILKVFALWGLWRKFLAHYHDFCDQKWSCFLRSSDTFWKFSPCEIYEKSTGRIFSICASNNEAVCREVQTHFGSSPVARFWVEFLGVSC